MKFCLECMKELTCKKTGATLHFGGGHCYSVDVFECPDCGDWTTVGSETPFQMDDVAFAKEKQGQWFIEANEKVSRPHSVIVRTAPADQGVASHWEAIPWALAEKGQEVWLRGISAGGGFRAFGPHRVKNAIKRVLVSYNNEFINTGETLLVPREE